MGTARIIGRRPCPWCGFAHAHVKQSEGKNPYHHCPECGTMTHAKNGTQARAICAGMRPEGQAPTPPAAAVPIAPRDVAAAVAQAQARTQAAQLDQAKPAQADQAAKPDQAAPTKRAGLWDQLINGGA